MAKKKSKKQSKNIDLFKLFGEVFKPDNNPLKVKKK